MPKRKEYELQKNLKNDWLLIFSKLLLHNERDQKEQKNKKNFSIP